MNAAGRHRAPWPVVKATAAAKQLGVDRELLNGLASSQELRAVKARGKSGTTVWLLNREDVDNLAARMSGASQ